MSVCSHGECSFLGKREKKKKKGGDFEATCIPKADISPSIDAVHPSSQVSFLHLEEVELVKQTNNNWIA